VSVHRTWPPRTSAGTERLSPFKSDARRN